MLTYFSLIIVGCILAFVCVLFYYSPGKPEPFLNTKGEVLENSLSVKTFIIVGGIRQGMFIRSKNLNNPVLLYVHGGPAFPNYFLFEKYKPGLEEHFTVCYWEQRGGGLSYKPDIPLETMTIEQLTKDAIEVTSYLRSHFGKSKIYLMAHSGGTAFAIQAAARAPQLYHAYIGMAQITRQWESEKIAYEYLEKQYASAGNQKALNKLKKYAVRESKEDIVSFFKSSFRDRSMHELGIGTMRNMKSVISGIFIPVWLCKSYTVSEKINIWTSKLSFVKKTRLIDELFQMDFTTLVPKLDIPVYFFSGQYDFTVNADLSRAYLEKLEAPVKAFYNFRNSAHSPLFEEPKNAIDLIEQELFHCGETSKKSY